MTNEERWAGLVATGATKCWRCHEHIEPRAESWQLGDDGRPEHVRDCKGDERR